MHPRIYDEFERICSERNITGSVLEVGAVPSKLSLLRMKSLQNATDKVGINLDGPYELADFTIYRGNANSMDMFEDEQFDLVLCNALLEHDKFFWKSIAEMNRVTKPGGTIVIGTPGYRHFWFDKVRELLTRVPILKQISNNAYLNMFFTATITFQVHAAPSDYYRFSPEAYKEVFFEAMENVEVSSVMLPPRIIGVGTKPLG